MGVIQSCEKANTIPGSFPVDSEELELHAELCEAATPDLDAGTVNSADAPSSDQEGTSNTAAAESTSSETQGTAQDTVEDSSLSDQAQPTLQEPNAISDTNDSEQDSAIESTETSTECIGKLLYPYFYTLSLACKRLV